MIEFDSSRAMEILSALESQLLPHYDLLHGIKEVLRHNSVVEWKHIIKDSKIPADILARESLTMSSYCIIFDEVPPSIRSPLVVNLIGLSLLIIFNRQC